MIQKLIKNIETKTIEVIQAPVIKAQEKVEEIQQVAEDSMMEEIVDATKPFWTSKTLWVNMLAILAMQLQNHFGYVISADTQAEIIGMINILLRIITKEPITWK